MYDGLLWAREHGEKPGTASFALFRITALFGSGCIFEGLFYYFVGKMFSLLTNGLAQALIFILASSMECPWWSLIVHFFDPTPRATLFSLPYSLKKIRLKNMVSKLP